MVPKDPSLPVEGGVRGREGHCASMCLTWHGGRELHPPQEAAGRGSCPSTCSLRAELSGWSRAVLLWCGRPGSGECTGAPAQSPAGKQQEKGCLLWAPETASTPVHPQLAAEWVSIPTPVGSPLHLMCVHEPPAATQDSTGDTSPCVSVRIRVLDT